MRKLISDYADQFPPHWKVQLLKRLFTVSSGDFLSPDDEADDGFPVYGGNGIRGYASSPNCSGETLLIGRVGALCGNVHLVSGEFWYSEHALRVFPRACFDNGFVKHLIAVIDLNRFANRTAQPLINGRTVTERYAGIPPLPEQKRIAAYLDASCAAIDRAVATKRQQLETLDALRKSIIQKAVTQGLNPEVEMKESGEDWLGPVPKHWKVQKLKRCGRLKGGAGFPHEEQGVTDAEIPFYKVKHLQATRYLTDCDNFVSRDTAKELGAEIMPPDTIVFAKVGAALLLNRFRILTRPGCIDNNMMALQIECAALQVPYFFHMLNLLDVGRFANQGPVPSINGSQVCRIQVPVPPSQEQEEIIKFVEAQASRIDELKAVITTQIETLTAYRKSLIHECVTGQRRISESDVAEISRQAKAP